MDAPYKTFTLEIRSIVMPPSDFISKTISQSDLTLGPELPAIAKDFFILPYGW